MTEFCQRLIDLARRRVRSGEISERGLARRASISQPHLHNVLKGIRALSVEAGDRLMRAMDVTLPQVVWSDGGVDVSDIGAVPVLRNRVGPGAGASFDTFRGFVPFPLGLVAPLTEPVAAYLAPDLALPSQYRAGDLVLLDLNSTPRLAPAPASCWIVAESAGLRVRYVRLGRGTLEVGRDPGLAEARDWQPISLQGRNILEIVRARIVWIGREMETPVVAGSPGPVSAGD